MASLIGEIQRELSLDKKWIVSLTSEGQLDSVCVYTNGWIAHVVGTTTHGLEEVRLKVIKGSAIETATSSRNTITGEPGSQMNQVGKRVVHLAQLKYYLRDVQRLSNVGEIIPSPQERASFASTAVGIVVAPIVLFASVPFVLTGLFWAALAAVVSAPFGRPSIGKNEARERARVDRENWVSMLGWITKRPMTEEQRQRIEEARNMDRVV